jgi:outer membrane lipoprotein SlyB
MTRVARVPRSRSSLTLGLLATTALLAACASPPPARTTAPPPSRIDYGVITAVQRVDIQNRDAQAAGALLGGALGAGVGSGRSTSNRALGGLAGASVGSRLAGAAGSTTGFEYTVLIGGTNTIRLVTEKASLRVGDCVSVERGRFNNIRLAADERCERPAAKAPRSAVREADACETATQQLLEAESDEDFARAERRMRILCD